MSLDFRDSQHLPKVRGDDGADPQGLPRQRAGTTPQMHGRYPEYDCLSQGSHWDALTRSVIEHRVEHVPARSFFSPSEESTLVAFCDVVLAQDTEPRVPVLAYVDEKLAAGRLDGYRYADLPDDRETWRLVAKGLDEAAHAHAGESYAASSPERRRELADAFAEGRLVDGVWATLDAKRAFAVVMRSVLAAFYSHPWAWNEIGFGGPAYPRGYARLGAGLSEAWEGPEAFEIDPVEDVQARGVA